MKSSDLDDGDYEAGQAGSLPARCDCSRHAPKGSLLEDAGQRLLVEIRRSKMEADRWQMLWLNAAEGFVKNFLSAMNGKV